MTAARVPSLLHDLIVHAERVREIYTRCGGVAALLVDQTAKGAIIERDIPQLITHATRLLSAYGPPPGN